MYQKNSKKLWIVSELYYPEATATGYILTNLAEGLAAKAISVSVLCSQPTYSARGIRAPSCEKRNKVNIHRCLGTTLDKDIFLFRIFNLITITFSLFLKSIFLFKRSDNVLVVTNPPSLPFLVAIACRLRGAKCVLLIHDVYPEILTIVGKLSSANILAYGFKWFNRKLYNSVKRIVVLGRDMQNLVIDKIDKKKEKVSVITNWADIEQVVPVRRTNNSLLKELRFQDKFVIGYAGNIGYPNDVDVIIDAAVRLSTSNDFHFLFIGSGIKKRCIEKAILHKRLSNITLLPNRPRDDQVNFLNACDVAIVSLVAGMKGVSVPSRIYNIMAAGKPIIAIVDSQSEVALVIGEESIGWTIQPNNPDKFVKIIHKAKSNPRLLQEMGKRARMVAKTKYSYENALNAYYSLFQNL